MPSEQSHLKRMILSQSVEGTAVPMVLFSDDTLAGVHSPDGAEQPAAVARAAARLGIDPEGLELFSFDAYRLQSALGEELAP